MPPRAPRAPRPELPLVARARAHADRTAIAAADGTFTYRELLDASAGVANCLLAGRADLAEARVAFLAPAGFRHVATQWGIWRAGGVAVPLAVSHPPPELEYVIRDAEAEIVVVHPDLAGSLEGVRLPAAVLTCALWSGARCEMLPHFDAVSVWSRLAAGELTLFMAVPAIYTKLIAAWEAAPPERRREYSAGCAPPRMRLMVSGSAALSVGTLERWRDISGQVLLERYGMTEIGMALANPLRGERRPGFVGAPLPGVEVRLVDDAGRLAAAGAPGEIEVRGQAVFLEYWRQSDATAAAFRDGWFRTGDVAVIENGAYRILGRRSVDIIKTGGYKVSALEIEEVLRTHPAVLECAVVGVDDPEWGERVCAAVELRGTGELTLAALQGWAKQRLAPYKVPRALRCVRALPRNAMGKVMKPDVAALFRPPASARRA